MSVSILSRINFVLPRLLTANCEPLMTNFAKGMEREFWDGKIHLCLVSMENGG